jgi:hypothetical protein
VPLAVTEKEVPVAVVLTMTDAGNPAVALVTDAPAGSVTEVKVVIVLPVILVTVSAVL